MFVFSLAFVAFFFFIGFFQSGPIGLFSVPNTPQERFLGYSLIIIGIIIFFLSFALFQKKVTKPFLHIIATVSFGEIFFFIFFGLSSDAINMYVPYIVVMLILYILVLKIEKKLEVGSKKISDEKTKYTRNILIAIPILILALVFFYFNFASILIENARKESNYRQVAGKLEYSLFEPQYLPGGYSKKTTGVGSYSDYVYDVYENKQRGRFVIAQFKKPTILSLSPPQCVISSRSGDNFELFYSSSFSTEIRSNCADIKSPKGLTIFIMKNPLSSVSRNYAVALKEDTLIVVDGYNFSQKELARLYDSLLLAK